MKGLIYNLFLSGCILYFPAIVAAMAGWKRLRNLFYLAAVALVFLSAVVRVYYNWPLLCLFQEPYLISLFVAIITLYLYARKDERSVVAAGILSVAISIFTLLFPGDIYTSFVKTNSLFAHLFSVLSSLARAAYMCSAALSLWMLIAGTFSGNEIKGSGQVLIKNLIIAGFALHSVGMFFGALWSYAGWGIPVQWESHLFLGMAGVWFFYSFYLHLHLAGRVKRESLSLAASLGGILVFIFTFLPDTGKLRLPELMR